MGKRSEVISLWVNSEAMPRPLTFQLYPYQGSQNKGVSLKSSRVCRSYIDWHRVLRQSRNQLTCSLSVCPAVRQVYNIRNGGRRLFELRCLSLQSVYIERENEIKNAMRSESESPGVRVKLTMIDSETTVTRKRRNVTWYRCSASSYIVLVSP